MKTKFTVDRPKVSDEELEKKKNFDDLVKKFKDQSLADAKTKQRSGINLKKLMYSTIILGVTVICSISINEFVSNKSNEKNNTSQTESKKQLIATQQKSCIQPIEKKKNYTTYKINAQKGGVINHSTKSEIKIPAKAFTNDKGDEITGEVEILYREMHTIPEIIASGIPMRYDSAGVKQSFESAGMIEIKGMQNGKEIALKQDKKIEINMASQKSGNQFNLYYLDTVAQQWQCLGKEKIIEPKSTLQEKQQNATSTSNVKANNEKITNEIHSLDQKISEAQKKETNHMVQTNLPTKPTPPVAASKQRKQFALDVDYREFPELKSFDGCVFEVGDENKHYSSEFNQIKWNDISIAQGTKAGINYTLVLTAGYRKEKLIVYPVFAAKNLEQAQQNYQSKLDHYNTIVAKNKEAELKRKEEIEKEIKKMQEERIALAKKLSAEENSRDFNIMYAQMNTDKNYLSEGVRRIFEINKFGIYNSDCAKTFPMHTVTEVVFMQNQLELIPATVFLVNHSDNMMWTYTLKETEQLKYDAKKKNSLIAFIQNKLFWCDTTAFHQAANQQTKKKSKTQFYFKELKDEDRSADGLKKILNL
jgi:hypothetical protein